MTIHLDSNGGGMNLISMLQIPASILQADFIPLKEYWHSFIPLKKYWHSLSKL